MPDGINQKGIPRNMWAVSVDDIDRLTWKGENEFYLDSKSPAFAGTGIGNNVSVEDLILGIKDGIRIEKMGEITEVQTGEGLIIKIKWNENWLPFDLQSALTSFQFGVKLILEEEKNRIPFFKGIIKNWDGIFHFESAPKRARMTLTQSEPQDEPKVDQGGCVTLFYGTTRKRIENSDVNLLYTEERDKLKFGFCSVSIPRGHIQGKIERPFHLWFIHFKEKEGSDVVLRSADEMKENAFFESLNFMITENSERDALLFIHGYNTSFSEAAYRAAQIAWDVPFLGVTGFFSWPSAGKLYGYPHDETNAEFNYSYLEEFIEKLIQNTKVEKLHIIAHSLGNKILSFALKNLNSKAELREKLKVIHQIILGAPDIDSGIFKKDILPALSDLGKRKTIYSSDKDIALKASEAFRLGLPRLGEAGKHLFVSKYTDTIDASNVKSSLLGHDYIFDAKELLYDLYYLLEKGFDPKERRLKKRWWHFRFVYWLFPK